MFLISLLFTVVPDGFRYAIHPEPRRKYFYVGGDCEKDGINTAKTKGAFNTCAIFSPNTSYWYIGAPDAYAFGIRLVAYPLVSRDSASWKGSGYFAFSLSNPDIFSAPFSGAIPDVLSYNTEGKYVSLAGGELRHGGRKQGTFSIGLDTLRSGNGWPIGAGR